MKKTGQEDANAAGHMASGPTPRPVWHTPTRRLWYTSKSAVRAMGLAVADNALCVCTDAGTIYRFVGVESGGTQPAPLPQDVAPERELDEDSDSTGELYRSAARRIMEATGLNEGYCVDLGCGDGALTHRLARQSNLYIIAVDKDPGQVAAARRTLSAAGLYGTRVTVMQRDPADTGLLPRFANLVVSGRAVTEDADAVPESEMKRILRPYGGMAVIGKPTEMRSTIGEPLQSAGEWTHQYADAANTLCSADDLAAAPLKMFWFKDFGFQMPSRHGRGPAPLFRKGIMVVQGVHALLGVDAYNGRELWRYPLEGILKAYDQEHLVGTASTGSNMCLADDSVFLRHGDHCLRINLETGRLIRTYPMPVKEGAWGFIACDEGILYGSSADRTHVVRQLYRNVSDMKDLLSQSSSLFAMDTASGETKWVYEAVASIRHNAIAIGNGRVYLIDKTRETEDLPNKRGHKEGATEDSNPPRLVCLDAATGKAVWEQNGDIYGTMLALSTKHGVLLMGYQYAQRTFQLPSEKGDRLTGFRTTDGKRLWDTDGKYTSRPIINDATVYTQPHVYDLLTGTRKEDFQVKGRQPGGCGPMSGSSHLLLYRSGTLGYTDLIKRTTTQNYGPMRPGCWINAIVAGGLVLMPDATDRCTCNYQMKVSVALAPMHETAK